MKDLKYKCTCWGCTLPQFLPGFLLEIASEIYLAKHIIPIGFNVMRGRFHTCRDAPDVVVDDLAHNKILIDDKLLSDRLQKDAIQEYELRCIKQEREQCTPYK